MSYNHSYLHPSFRRGAGSNTANNGRCQVDKHGNTAVLGAVRTKWSSLIADSVSASVPGSGKGHAPRRATLSYDQQHYPTRAPLSIFRQSPAAAAAVCVRELVARDGDLFRPRLALGGGSHRFLLLLMLLRPAAD
jgi:hypothetical protein